MEYLIIGLLIVILILIFVLLFKRNNNREVNELKVDMIREIGNFKTDFSRDISEDFNKLNDRILEKIRMLDENLNSRMDKNFEKTNKTFQSVLESLARIDEAQKKIDVLSKDIISLENILTDKKTRGIFGEVNLEHIMANVFGENNSKIYKMQYKFSNDTIADCVLFAPEPLGTIAIDSKFPLEHYQIMVDKSKSEMERLEAEKEFKADMKKHIDDISNKYIIPNVTSNQAMMFLPAEAIFAYLNAYYSDVIEYAYKKRVWITSPTTLISTLTTIEVVIKNMERDKYATIIHQELNILAQEFKRYKERWDKLSRSIETVSNDVKDIHTTTEKITKRFDSINQVEMDKREYLDNEN